MPRVLIYIVVLCCCTASVHCFNITFPLIRAMGLRMLRSYMHARTDTTQQRLDNILTSLTAEASKVLPHSVPTQAIDVFMDGGGYVCSSPAVLEGLQTISKPDKVNINSNDDGSMDIFVIYTFDHLIVSYEKLICQYVFTKKFQLSLKGRSVKLAVELKLQGLFQLLKRIFTRKCVIHIKRVEVLNTNNLQIEVREVETTNKSVFTTFLAQILLNRSYELIKKAVNDQVIVELYRALVRSGSWVCRDKSLEKMAEENFAHMLSVVPWSYTYRKMCA